MYFYLSCLSTHFLLSARNFMSFRKTWFLWTEKQGFWNIFG